MTNDRIKIRSLLELQPEFDRYFDRSRVTRRCVNRFTGLNERSVQLAEAARDFMEDVEGRNELRGRMN
jgi:hypothetical protein